MTDPAVEAALDAPVPYTGATVRHYIGEESMRRALASAYEAEAESGQWHATIREWLRQRAGALRGSEGA